MEVEAPEEPIITWKQFLIHIGTVTLGILIALSLEGLVEWNHHRHMINEARENIRSEIEDNLKDLRGHLAEAEKNRKDAHNVLIWTADMQEAHKSSIKALQIGYNLADLSSSSWATAQAVGTLGLMNYAEVKRTAAVYQLQEELKRLQTRAEDAAIASMTNFNDSQPEKMSAEQLTQEVKEIKDYLTALHAQDQIGTQLQKRYTEWLAAK